jgi:tight adherence protein C
VSLATEALAFGGVAMVGLGLGTAAFALARTGSAEGARLGLRGLKRQLALSESATFAAFEPLIRSIAAFYAHVAMPDLRAKLERRITQAGDLLGLTPEEHLAMSTLWGLGLVSLALLFHELIGTSPLVLGPIVLLGAYVPHARLMGEVKRRQLRVSRTLPIAIDLAALAMGAGLDFPSALRQITEKALAPDEPLHEELTRILHILDLGRTRKEALEAFAERVPSEAVQDFVSSVIQAEEKGTPLANALKVQARMLRMRRSHDAENAASRAGVMMLMPLMLIFGSILVILLGPFVLGGLKSGF